MELTEAVRRRRMVRNYRDEPVPRETLARILDTARRAPSAGFAQGQRFVVVTDASQRTAIAALAQEPDHTARGFDPWLSSAPAHVALCVDHEAYATRYGASDKLATGGRSEWPVPYEVMDAGASMMLLLLAATDAGLAAGFFGAHRLPGLGPLLGIPDHVTAVGVVTIGHPAPDRRSRSLDAGWLPSGEVVHWDRWRSED